MHMALKYNTCFKTANTELDAVPRLSHVLPHRHSIWIDKDLLFHFHVAIDARLGQLQTSQLHKNVKYKVPMRYDMNDGP